MEMTTTMPSMALVSLDQVTHTAVASGNWSDPATWVNGVVPGEGARVHIPQGFDVKVDTMLVPEMKTVRIDGTLSFATDANTELKVDTLVSTSTGHLQIGTASDPVQADVTAKVTFADDGAIDRNWDPSLISRGALLHGKTTIYGAEKTAFTTVAEFPMAGDTTITLSSIPTGWKIGDTIAIAGTDPQDPTKDEKVTITAIDGATVTFDQALVHDHAAPRPDLDVHVANLSRNVEFTSENAAAAHRGHVMVMHTNDADMNFVAFDDLGRSDKALGYNDHEFVDLSPFIDAIELGGDNVRGRYSVHFHKGGTDKDGAPAKVNGAVVTDDIGWGFVNHSSHVDFTNNVTHNIVGAAYFTEAGDEIGSFTGNLAMRTVNPNFPLEGGPESDLVDPDSREGRQDYGFQGDGFWFHSPNVQVEGNVVSGASGHAYIWWPEGLLEKTADGSTSKVLHDTANVPNGNLIGPDGTKMEIHDVPIGSFDGNQAYSATKGVQIFYLHTDFFGNGLNFEDNIPITPQAYDDQLRSTLSNTTIWNVDETAFAAPYVNRITVDGLRVVNNGETDTTGVDLAHFRNDQGIELKNATIEGFGTGLKLTTTGAVLVEGTTFNGNGTDIQNITPSEDGDEAPEDDVDPEEPMEPGDDDADPEEPMEPGDDDGDPEEPMEPGDDDQDPEEPTEPDDEEEDPEEPADEDPNPGDDPAGTVTRIAFLGDSISTDSFEDGRFTDYLSRDGGVEIQTFGLGSAGLTPDSGLPIQQTDTWQGLLASEADIVWIMIGGNDIDGGATAQSYAQALTTAVADIKTALGDVQIYIAAQPPFSAFLPQAYETFLAEWVPAMQQVADDNGAMFVDLGAQVSDYPANYPDDIHPNAEGAKTIAGIVADTIPEITGTTDAPVGPMDDGEEEPEEEPTEDPVDDEGEDPIDDPIDDPEDQDDDGEDEGENPAEDGDDDEGDEPRNDPDDAGDDDEEIDDEPQEDGDEEEGDEPLDDPEDVDEDADEGIDDVLEDDADTEDLEEDLSDEVGMDCDEPDDVDEMDLGEEDLAEEDLAEEDFDDIDFDRFNFIEGTEGSDSMVGSVKADVFEIGQEAVDTILDFMPSEDRIDLSDFDIASVDDLEIEATAEGTGISLMAHGQEIAIVTFADAAGDMPELTPDNFIFNDELG